VIETLQLSIANNSLKRKLHNKRKSACSEGRVFSVQFKQSLLPLVKVWNGDDTVIIIYVKQECNIFNDFSVLQAPLAFKIVGVYDQ